MEPVLHSTPTIVAVASPPGRSPRGLLRVSGPGTGQVLRRLLCAVPVAMRELLPVRLADPALPGLLVRFAAPASYTGEDAAELQVPGNATLLDRLLHLAIAADTTGSTRLAEPGEFTFRAYTAGKLDLTQAEGVAATIHATSDSQLRAATLLREGRLGRAANGYVDTLGNLLALVEAGIDFTDQEDVVPIAPSELLHHLSTLYVQLQDTLSNSRPWGAVESLPRVVLVGPPSAGKSTLFNALLGRERAVIDPMPGTTRDVLAEPLRLMTLSGQPAEVMLVDIAGLDHGIGLLDTAAQRAAEAAIRRADLLLYLTPRGGRSPEPTWDLPTLRVLTMMDRPECSRDPINQDWGVSAHTGEGLEQLKALIARHVGRLAVSVNAEMLTLQSRHEAGLRSAAAHLGTACSVLSGHQGSAALPDIELLADTMRAALDALAGLGGRLTPDEVIGRVFATFCVGK